MIFFLEIDHVSVASVASGYAAGCIDPHSGFEEQPLNFGQSAEVIVALHQQRMERTGRLPAEFLSQTYESFTLVGKDGQLHVIRAEGHGAECQQVDFFGRQLSEKLVGLLGGIMNSDVEVFNVAHTE